MQVLRTRFTATPDGPQQVILSASAVEIHSAAAQTNGSSLLQRQADGLHAISTDSSLAAEWRQVSAAPFDLYSDTLTRIQVRITQRLHVRISLQPVTCQWAH